jgi:hypothetical protein
MNTMAANITANTTNAKASKAPKVTFIAGCPMVQRVIELFPMAQPPHAEPKQQLMFIVSNSCSSLITTKRG